jgi:hypothetical protein
MAYTANSRNRSYRAALSRNGASAMDNMETNETAVEQEIKPEGRVNKYFFKKQPLTDENGNETGETFKHPDVIAYFKEPSVEEITELMQTNDQVRKLICDLVFDAIVAQGKQQIQDWWEKNPGQIFNPTYFDHSKLTLEYIASIPPKQRGAWSPDKEDIAEFVADYRNTMLNAVAYDPKKVAHHCKNLEKGLTKIKGEKEILRRMQELLTLYAANSENLEENQRTYDWFQERIDRWLKVEDKPRLDAF